jgi:glycosyltransferase involved in cell wall biosynthesis
MSTAMTEKSAMPSAQKPATVARPLVSVCISAYNVERFVGTAVRSVLAQTYSNLEVIFIDNGCTDETYEAARAVADERVRFVRVMPNMGGYQAMNQAVTLARGDLIAIYHSDDFYEPNIVEKEAAYLQAHPEAGAVFCMEHFMDEQGAIFGGASLPAELRGRDPLSYADVFPFLLRRKNILFCCPSFMVRRLVWDTVGPFDADRLDIGSDLDMWIRIVRRFPVGVLDERLMRYRVTGKQWSARYKRLRTEPDVHFPIMDEYLAKDGWLARLSRRDLVEYAFHRCDDDTVRAANWVIQREPAKARPLLQGGYPWRTLLYGIRRRKLRVLLLRTLMRAGLALGADRSLARLLAWTEYGGKLSEGV